MMSAIGLKRTWPHSGGDFQTLNGYFSVLDPNHFAWAGLTHYDTRQPGRNEPIAIEHRLC
jgi:hypothetical protein